MAESKNKKFKTVVEAAFAATDKLKIQPPQDEVFRREPNFGGYGTKLNKAKGDPSQTFNEHYNRKGGNMQSPRYPYYDVSSKPNQAPKKKKSTAT